MKALLSALFLLLFPLGAFCVPATITLYDVAAPRPTEDRYISYGVSVTFSPVGVGQNSRTTYIEEIVPTKKVDVHSDTTITASTPLQGTVTLMVEENASGLLEKIWVGSVSTDPQQQITRSCDFQGTTAGSCVQVQEDVIGMMTYSTAYSGTLFPVYTLTETASIPGQTQNSGALTGNSVWSTSTCRLVGLLFGIWVTLLVVWL